MTLEVSAACRDAVRQRAATFWQGDRRQSSGAEEGWGGWKVGLRRPSLVPYNLPTAVDRVGGTGRQRHSFP